VNPHRSVTTLRVNSTLPAPITVTFVMGELWHRRRGPNSNERETRRTGGDSCAERLRRA
jgi:hypothetical protein